MAPRLLGFVIDADLPPGAQAKRSYPRKTQQLRPGVMRRSRPALDARLPHGLVEGALVDVPEHSGARARVRGTGSVEGWVPSRYLAVAG